MKNISQFYLVLDWKSETFWCTEKSLTYSTSSCAHNWKTQKSFLTFLSFAALPFDLKVLPVVQWYTYTFVRIMLCRSLSRHVVFTLQLIIYIVPWGPIYEIKMEIFTSHDCVISLFCWAACGGRVLRFKNISSNEKKHNKSNKNCWYQIAF